MFTRFVKVVSIPALLLASIFARYAGPYEFALNLAICLGAVVCVQRAVYLRQYYWGGAFVAVAIVFSPFLLVVKIFVLMGLSCVATLGSLVAAFRRQPLAVVGQA